MLYHCIRTIQLSRRTSYRSFPFSEVKISLQKVELSFNFSYQLGDGDPQITLADPTKQTQRNRLSVLSLCLRRLNSPLARSKTEAPFIFSKKNISKKWWLHWNLSRWDAMISVHNDRLTGIRFHSLSCWVVEVNLHSIAANLFCTFILFTRYCNSSTCSNLLVNSVGECILSQQTYSTHPSIREIL